MTGRKGAVFFGVAAGAVLAFMLQTSVAFALEVRLRGEMNDEMKEALEGGSLLFEQSGSEEPLDPREIVSTAQADYRRLLAILYDAGYFGPTIGIKLDGKEAADILAVSPPKSISKAVITIERGRRFRFGKVQVSPLASGTKLPMGFKTGERARASVVANAAKTGVSAWRDAGHAKAQLAGQQITARHDRSRIDAQVQIDPGPRLRFGALEMVGESAVRSERILEIAGLPEGTVFSPKELEDAAARLRRTGAFRSVSLLEGHVAAGSDILPVDVRVADNEPRRFGFGVELATIEGMTLSGFWMHRNFLGGAENLRIDAEIGGIGGDTGGTDYLLRSRFLRPATFNEDTNFYALGELEREDEPNYFSRQVTVGTGIERIESDQRRYTFGVALRRAITEDTFGDSDYTLFMVPTGAIFDYRNNELDARRGYYADAELTPFLALKGTDNGLLSELDFRTYFSFGSSSPTTLALRAQLGSVLGPSLQDAPADFLFYSGGGGTVRGQEYQSLGVQIGPDEDNIVGGRSFLGLSAELRMRTSGSLGYVAFVDGGYIGPDAFPDDTGEWHSGAGLGIRYKTPIGPLRFDFAVPLSGSTGDENFQLYFGIGQAF